MCVHSLSIVYAWPSTLMSFQLIIRINSTWQTSHTTRGRILLISHEWILILICNVKILRTNKTRWYRQTDRLLVSVPAGTTHTYCALKVWRFCWHQLTCTRGCHGNKQAWGMWSSVIAVCRQDGFLIDVTFRLTILPFLSAQDMVHCWMLVTRFNEISNLVHGNLRREGKMTMVREEGGRKREEGGRKGGERREEGREEGREGRGGKEERERERERERRKGKKWGRKESGRGSKVGEKWGSKLEETRSIATGYHSMQ